MAVPIDLLNNAESSDEDFSDSEISYASEDESMEDEPPEAENTIERETEPDRTEEEKFWVQYPYLKSFLGNIVAQGLIPEYFAFERARLIGDEKAKELNEKCEALSIMELELCSDKCELIASAISQFSTIFLHCSELYFIEYELQIKPTKPHT